VVQIDKVPRRVRLPNRYSRRKGLEGKIFIPKTKVLGRISCIVLAEELMIISYSTMEGSGRER
jgi:hypothetical protein